MKARRVGVGDAHSSRGENVSRDVKVEPEKKKKSSRIGKGLRLGMAGLFVIITCMLIVASHKTTKVEVAIESKSSRQIKVRRRLVRNLTPIKRPRLKEGQRDILLESMKGLNLDSRKVASKSDWPGVSSDKQRKVMSKISSPKGLKRFLRAWQDFDSLAVLFRYLGEKHPQQIAVGSIGNSVQGRPIIALRLSASSRPNSRPNVVVLGGEHGREHTVPMALAHSIIGLVDNGGLFNASLLEDETFLAADVLDYCNLIFIPIANPDGFAYTFSATLDEGGKSSEADKRIRFWRKNRQTNQDGSIGVDLNRNWGSRGFTWGHGQAWTQSEVYMGTAPFSAPETAAVRDFLTGNGDTKSDARVIRAARQGRVLETLASGFVAVHCCIGGVLQPRNYCTVNDRVERAHAAIGQEMVRTMNAAGVGGTYSFKRRRKTQEISSSGISIDSLFYDFFIPFPFMIETSPRSPEGQQTVENGEEDEDGEIDSRSIAQQRKDRIRDKMAADRPEDLPFVGIELMRSIAVHAGLVSTALAFNATSPLDISPWGYLHKSKPSQRRAVDMYSCKTPGKPDLIPLDPCSGTTNKLKPWIKCKKEPATKKKRKH